MWDSDCVHFTLGIRLSLQPWSQSQAWSPGVTWSHHIHSTNFIFRLLAESFYVIPVVKFTAKDRHWPIKIRLIALPSHLHHPVFYWFPSLCWNTRLPLNHFWLIYLFAFGPVQMLLTAWWRHSGQKRLIVSTARAAWQGFWRTGEEETVHGGASVQMGFYFPPSSTGRGAGVHWRSDRWSGEKLIDGTGVLRCQAELD